MFTLTRAEWSYVAGLIDGEGSIGIEKSSTRLRPTVAIDSTDPELLDWLESRLGGSRVKKKRYADHHRQAWTWRVKDNRALAVLAAVRSLLVIERKRMRAETLVDEWPRVTARNGRYTPEMLVARNALVERLRSAHAG